MEVILIGVSSINDKLFVAQYPSEVVSLLKQSFLLISLHMIESSFLTLYHVLSSIKYIKSLIPALSLKRYMHQLTIAASPQPQKSVV